MLKEGFFILKALVTTMSIVALLQYKVGGVSLETKFHNWVVSVMENPGVDSLVEGGAMVSRDTVEAVKGEMKGRLQAAQEMALGKAQRELSASSHDIKEQTREALKKIEAEIDSQSLSE